MNISAERISSTEDFTRILSVVLQIRDVVGDILYRFRPVVHLRTGRTMALEVRACPAAGDLDHLRPVTGIAERLIQLDVRFAVEAIRRAAEYDTLIPLHVNLWADTVCAEHNPLAPLVGTMHDIGADPSHAVIRLIVPQGEPVPPNFATGLARLRAAGFGVGLDAAGTYPMTTLIEAAPEALVLAARHCGGLHTVPAARAALAGAAALATQIGAMLIADGCDTTEQAVALREHGVDLVQGELLGPSRRRPSTQPVPAALLEQITSRPEAGAASAPGPGPAARPDRADTVPARNPLVADLAHPAATMPEDTPGETARAVFADRPELSSLILVDEAQRPVRALNRDRFMLAITGPFGHSLHARRPAAGLGDPPRTLDMRATVSDAIDMLADTPSRWMYDDILVLDDGGRCHGVLRVGDLVRDLAQRQAAGRHQESASMGP